MQRALIVAAALLISSAVAGCRAAADPSAAIADAQTAVRVKTALVNDPTIGVYAIEVRVSSGVVSLSGGVRSQADAVRAIDLARAVPGVTDVRSNLRASGEPPAPADTIDRTAPQIESSEIESRPGLLTVGVGAGRTSPRAATLEHRLAISPLVKFGSPQGLGPAIGFDWFHADLTSADNAAPIGRVHVRPIMLGLGYTLTSERFSFSPSIVAGFAFNSLTISDTIPTGGLPVSVDNSFAWRVGVSTWYDVTTRTAINVSAGYLDTSLRLGVVNGGRLTGRTVAGDTVMVRLGLGYRLF